jgi:putative endonuclease
MFVVYCLYSAKFEKIYIGFTSNLIQRFKGHNSLSKMGCTHKYRPWIVILVEPFDRKKDAMIREKQLKGAKGRTWIRETIIPYYQENL